VANPSKEQGAAKVQKKKILGAIFGCLFTLIVTPAVNATVITTGYIELRNPYNGGFTFDFMVGGLSVYGWADEGSKYFQPSLYEGDAFNGNQDNRPPNDLFGGYVEDEGVEWRNAWEPFSSRFDTRAEGSVLTAGQTVYTLHSSSADSCAEERGGNLPSASSHFQISAGRASLSSSSMSRSSRTADTTSRRARHFIHSRPSLNPPHWLFSVLASRVSRSQGGDLR
jgi:hypothetical protein